MLMGSLQWPFESLDEWHVFLKLGNKKIKRLYFKLTKVKIYDIQSRSLPSGRGLIGKAWNTWKQRKVRGLINTEKIARDVYNWDASLLMHMAMALWLWGLKWASSEYRCTTIHKGYMYWQVCYGISTQLVLVHARTTPYFIIRSEDRMKTYFLLIWRHF